jgi:hypothetical protein
MDHITPPHKEIKRGKEREREHFKKLTENKKKKYGNMIYN